MSHQTRSKGNRSHATAKSAASTTHHTEPLPVSDVSDSDDAMMGDSDTDLYADDDNDSRTFTCHMCRNKIDNDLMLEHTVRCYRRRCIATGIEPACTCKRCAGIRTHPRASDRTAHAEYRPLHEKQPGIRGGDDRSPLHLQKQMGPLRGITHAINDLASTLIMITVVIICTLFYLF
jgi:hypothetical protein